MASSTVKPVTDYGSADELARVVVINPSGERREIAIVDERVTIGRSEQVEIQLEDQNAVVSRRHADMYLDTFGQWHLNDLDSINGTRINGQEIIDAVWREGEEAQIGEYRLTLSASSTPLSTPEYGQTLVIEAGDRRAPVSDTSGTHYSTMGEGTSEKIDTSHLADLNLFAQSVGSFDTPAARLQALCELVVREEFHGTCALALRVRRDALDEQPHILCQATPDGHDNPPYVSRGLLKMVVRSETPALASYTSNDPGAVQMTIVTGQDDIAAIACPLSASADVVDLLYVTLPPDFGTGEWLTLMAHAAQTYSQVEMFLAAQQAARARAVLERDLEQASQLQHSLVPDLDQINVAHLDLAIGFEPCRGAGGDYVDVIHIADDRVLLVCADVSGKGMGAALIASTLHSLVHTCHRLKVGLDETMRAMNEHLYTHTDDKSFVTAVCMILDGATGSFEVANAGHPAPTVITPTGEIKLLQAGENFPLGIMPYDPVIEKGSLGEGDMLALFTDGLTELTDSDDRELGPERIAEHLRELYTGHAPGEPPAPAQQVAAGLQETLDTYLDGRSPGDDRTFLLVARNSSG